MRGIRQKATPLLFHFILIWKSEMEKFYRKKVVFHSGHHLLEKATSSLENQRVFSPGKVLVFLCN
jgi:hypothetical protein